MAVQMGMGYGPKLVLAILTLIIGLWIINSVGRRVSKSFEKGGVDQTLSNFLFSLVSVGLKALLFISVAAMVGIETTSCIAV
jgi:small conductance mechanosensitive channel